MAAERGLATGDKSATRMQVLLALYVAAGSPASDVSVDLSHFKDAANVPGEALNAVLWAVQNGHSEGHRRWAAEPWRQRDPRPKRRSGVSRTEGYRLIPLSANMSLPPVTGRQAFL